MSLLAQGAVNDANLNDAVCCALLATLWAWVMPLNRSSTPRAISHRHLGAPNAARKQLEMDARCRHRLVVIIVNRRQTSTSSNQVPDLARRALITTMFVARAHLEVHENQLVTRSNDSGFQCCVR